MAQMGTCPGTEWSAPVALAMACEVENGFGICSGYRVCPAEGLAECDAPVPVDETCNGVDDDCDGSVDEATCDDANECTVDSCGGAEGCKNEPLNEGECNDGNACTTGDKCFAAECKGTGGLACSDGVVCTTDSCEPAAGCIYTPIVPCCSNGIVEPPEQCDDGNLTPGDGCEANCTKPAWVKVGSYKVNDGPAWGSNPPCYTGREACAKVFGGSASQYQGSTDANTINNKASHSVWGISGCSVQADTYKKSVNYNCGGTNCSSSAYVTDNCSGAVNYCWKLQ